MELKEFKRVLRVQNQRHSDILCKTALDALNNKDTLVYCELDIHNIDKILLKFSKEIENEEDQYTSKFKNVLFTLRLDDEPACFILRFKGNDGRMQRGSVCAVHFIIDEDNQVLASLHYLDRQGENKISQRISQSLYKVENGDIYSFENASKLKGRVISLAYSIQMILNKYCLQEKIFSQGEELNNSINEFFQDYVKDELLKIEESKQDIDLTNAINLLNSDDSGRNSLSFTSNI